LQIIIFFDDVVLTTFYVEETEKPVLQHTFGKAVSLFRTQPRNCDQMRINTKFKLLNTKYVIVYRTFIHL